MSLRERKKQQTRERLAHAATLLFIERGFEDVTIAEVAEAAGVSKMTVTNYFPLKEDLVFDFGEEMVDSLARVVRERRPGESALAALHRAYLEALEAGLPFSGHSSPGFARLVHGSPRLRARERVIEEQGEAALALALAEQTGAAADDLLPHLSAAQLAAVHRVLHARVRSLIRAGAPQHEVRDRAAAEADAAFARLAPALGDYCA
ncbi:TetR/AcrR family transcriptional regulator [Kitasatospora azatica]|uniref:TetR/AcrR family transcriptional regulator n=1 Tax=Kitasatospora azatica TaxID=58347 RepID=UPI000567FF1F|nr:TetR family transcriptional regulator [Kitasatospora azatica]